MRPSHILKKWRQDEPALIFAVQLHDPAVFEMVSLMGLDGIWLDMEHAPLGMSQAAQLMRAARVGSADIVARPGKGETMRMLRMLEAGASLIMYPRCQSVDEAREVAQWCKFAPMGQRGFDGGNPDSPYGSLPPAQYIRSANEQTGLIIQIEDQATVEIAEQLAAVEGVDALLLGPADFSVQEGIPGQFDHPKLTAARKQIAAAARKHGKVWGQPVRSVEHARELINEGARLLAIGSDRSMIRSGIAHIRKTYREVGITFSPNALAHPPASYLDRLP